MAGHWDRLSSGHSAKPARVQKRLDHVVQGQDLSSMILEGAFPLGISRTHLTRCKIRTFVRSLTSDILQNQRSETTALKRVSVCCAARFVWVITHRKEAGGISTSASQAARALAGSARKAVGKAQPEKP